MNFVERYDSIKVLVSVATILGTGGAVLSLAVAAMVLLWCRQKQRRKSATSPNTVSIDIFKARYGISIEENRADLLTKTMTTIDTISLTVFL